MTLLLDSGAQTSFITTSAVKRLGLHVYDHQPITLTAFGGHQTTEVSGKADLTLIDLFDKQLTVFVRTKDKLTSPTTSPGLPKEDIDFIRQFGFDLPTYHEDASVNVDILIGIDHFWDIITQGSSVCLPSGLVLTHTRFGTVVSGSSFFSQVHPVSTSTGMEQWREDDEDEDIVVRLWQLERLGITDQPHDDENAIANSYILKHFEDTACFHNGFLYVQFPWKESHPQLADNKQLAYCRLVSQYRSLQERPSVWRSYCAAIAQHLESGFIEEVSEQVDDSHLVYYIPHQAVFKESSATTKLRVVFDASSHMRGVPSLNDCLYEGPSLLPEIAGIQLRARLHKYLLIADVEKAFHQVRLQVSQRDVTRFLWLKDVNRPPDKDNLRHFRFTRIPFGVKSSPFILAASIRIYLHRINTPLCREIERNTYVDNVVLGASTQDEAVQKYRSAKSIFDHMHMNLREFLCSSNIVNRKIDPQDRIKEPEHTKLLGIPWTPDPDVLTIPIKTIEHPVVSKRTALKAYASTYDPLGLLTPFMVPFKLFIQDLWLKKLKLRIRSPKFRVHCCDSPNYRVLGGRWRVSQVA
ncbi:unnamed protein product [Cylicocyclus nassatus]|uniref:Reverse transcriptase domain-containing protein n=1 Tax=Cylicocyclus nassatus TaxID=53992 RepID=A0AA36MBT1_CYLNA|nr:unnamed protein product [Cylicocyclus nassatus]